MHRFNRIIAFALLLVVGIALVQPVSAQEATRLLRQPTLSITGIVFVYGGDLWIVSRSGGMARRLTANPSIKRFPQFSPDGKWIAFTGNYDGNADVYVIPAEGGEPKRLTFHPAPDEVVGWTPDSKSIIFRSIRASVSNRADKLFTVPITGGLEHELPMPEGTLASLSSDGAQIAYNRINPQLSSWNWKRYRGGAQAYISLYDFSSHHYSEIPHTDVTDLCPMWHGDKIYFVSDRTGTINLFSYDVKSRAVKQLTQYRDYDVKWPSLGPDAIVFELGGVLQLFDLATEKVTPVPIEVRSDLAATRPEWRHVENYIGGFGISPSGARAVFEARGDIFTVPAKKGETRDITNTSGAREIDPAWSPDGKLIAYLSDRSGEFEVYVRPQDGSGSETRITTDGNLYRNGLQWSPDSKALLYTDAAMRLWMVTLADKKPVLVDSSTIGPIGLGRWSPDSKWLVYTKPFPNQNQGLFLYSTEQRKVYPITDGYYNDTQPVFDPDGKFLYFLSDRTFVPHVTRLEVDFDFQNTTGLFALTLQRKTPSPFEPESDEEKPKDDAAKTKSPMSDTATSGASSETKIDLEGLAGRLIAIPTPPGNYTRLDAAAGKLFYSGDNVLHQYELSSRSDSILLSGVQGYSINPSGTKLIYQAGPGFGIADVAPGIQPGAGRLALSLVMKIDPRQEWKQIFWEVWRRDRDFYYDPNMHGLNWKAIGERYSKLLPYVTHRDDLTYLLTELQGELSTSHAFLFPAEGPPSPQVNVGLLGVDFGMDGNYYRFKKIYAGENWIPDRRSPLTEPGMEVQAGNYLIAVNGTPLHADTNPYALFEGTANRMVTLRVNSKPSEEGAWDIRVRTIADEHGLRYFDWTESNRRHVEEATGGRVGYVHVPDTAMGGMTEFGKGFYAQTDKEALIVDERYNDGGFIPDFFVEKLNRKLLAMTTPRYGSEGRSPGGAIYGPKAMLVNEWAGSGGDALPAFFRLAGVGPLIGKRTAGGLVGISGFDVLIDGGVMSTPGFGTWSPLQGKWIAENHGVDPDIEVSNTPDEMNQGRDPQLERAIAYLKEQLNKNPSPKYQHPAFPVDRLSSDRQSVTAKKD